MKFFQYLTAALLPVTVFATPAAEPEPKAATVPATISGDDYNVLVQRQLDLGSVIGDLTDALGAIKDLLSLESLNNINQVVTDLASLLKDPTTKQIKSLVGTAADLLGGDALGGLLEKLPALLESVSGLLTEATLKKITTLLDNAAILLTKEFATNTRNLINDIAPLVSAIAQVISALLGAILG
ncbi:hypothetical protein BDW59DRAFT_161151 [Aspergillus cavernicola]|uniref:Hydrophobic surface binding protein A-domain-containing protein n=1 Tax=Aspergillus cavernicola TaxID=176166 RepID=A0ABR4IEZ6_9EURO